MGSARTGIGELHYVGSIYAKTDVRQEGLKVSFLCYIGWARLVSGVGV